MGVIASAMRSLQAWRLPAFSPLSASKQKHVRQGVDVAHFLIATAQTGVGQVLGAALAFSGGSSCMIEDFDFSDRDAVRRRFTAEVGVDAVVIIVLPDPHARRAAALLDLDEGDWVSATDIALRGSLYAMQAARASLEAHGGAIICAGPVVGLSGARDLAALATLAEGQRALVKSAARQWGHHGITVNWVSLPTAVLAPELADIAFPQSPELGVHGPSLGRAPGVEDLAALVGFLAGPGGKSLLGASINLDGGEWMLP